MPNRLDEKGMTRPASSGAAAAQRRAWSCWIALILVVLVSGLIRYRLIGVPLERDEGEYAYVGQLILQGVPPYQQAYNMKWPGIYAIYALVLAVFGQTHQGIHTGLLIVNSLTIVLLFLFVNQLIDRSAAVIAASVFAILSLGQSVHGIFANAEHFVILFSLAGLLFLLKAMKNNSRFQLCAAGVLLGLAAIIKQHGLMFFFPAAFYVFIEGFRQKPFSWKPVAAKLLLLSAGLVTVLMSMLFIIAVCGVFEQFWLWTVDYARAYVSQVPLAYAGKSFWLTFPVIFGSAPLIWVLAGCGLVLTMAAKQLQRPQKMFVLLFVLFSMLSICPGFYFRRHYFLMVLPCVALLCGVSICFLSRNIASLFFSGRFSRSLAVLMTAAGVGQSILHQYDYLFRMSPFEVCRSTYCLNPFFESLAIADYIREHTTAADTIAVIGSEPQILFYAQRRSATGFMYMYPLMEDQPFALEMQRDFIREIEAKQPAYCIVVHIPQSWLQGPSSQTLLIDWMKSYVQTNHEMIGSIELFDDGTDYHWFPQVKWPVSSEYYIVVFKHSVGQQVTFE